MPVGRGPAPKHNRQRRQTPSRGEWVRLEPLDGPLIPPLDDFEAPDEVWPMRTRIQWEAWMEDPATALWNKGDLAFAIDTIYLHATGASGKSAEIRLRMESLGLTPKGRADRRLLLPDEPVPAGDAAGTPADAPDTPGALRVLPAAV